MSAIPLLLRNYFRAVAKEARIYLRNRYFEKNPVLTDEQTAAIARPGLKRWVEVGEGPIRGIYSQPGTFEEALFVVSGSEWYRVEIDGTSTLLQSSITGDTAAVSMTGTGNIGDVPAYMFLADGTTLYVYDGSTVSVVATPDDVHVISVGYVASYVVVVPAQGQDINGRFYWIEPGEITIDPLNFATAERAPDPISGVVVFGDQFWLPGSITMEPWYFTGDPNSPVQRQQGVVFDRGSWPGTAVQVKDSMIMVSSDGAIFENTGTLEKISSPDIEELVRKAIKAQASI